MLKDLGCSSNAARICELYLSDDLSFKRDFKTVSDSLPKVLGFVFSHTGLKAGLAERFRAVLNILQNGGAIVDDLIQTRCQRGAQIARQLRFPASVCVAIHALWTSTGTVPAGRTVSRAPPSRSTPASPSSPKWSTCSTPQPAPPRQMAEMRGRSGTWFESRGRRLLRGGSPPNRASGRRWPRRRSRRAVLALAPVSPIVVDEDYLDDIARAFAQIIDAKSPFTSGHSERVAVYSDMIAAELGYTPERRAWLKRAALLHDVGKLGVSNAILDKNGKLDEAEWQDMRNHAALSETILARVPVFHEMASIGGGHHERLDGKGYPRGLTGDEIAPQTRIVSVADVFDALTADRPYRAAMPLEKALGLMRADLGTAFDPTCFAALERVLAAIEGDLARAA